MRVVDVRWPYVHRSLHPFEQRIMDDGSRRTVERMSALADCSGLGQARRMSALGALSRHAEARPVGADAPKAVAGFGRPRRRMMPHSGRCRDPRVGGIS
jgi:hypothetical protein